MVLFWKESPKASKEGTTLRMAFNSVNAWMMIPLQKILLTSYFLCGVLEPGAEGVAVSTHKADNYNDHSGPDIVGLFPGM